MTLLEAIVAMIILSLVGVGCLELTHGASTLETRSVAWNDAVSEAESRMATAVLSAPMESETRTRGMRDSVGTSVTRTAWHHGLDDIAVTVRPANGVAFTLHRLVPAARSAR